MTRFAGRHLAQDRLVLSSVSNATEDYIMIDSQRIAEVMGGAEAIGERARTECPRVLCSRRSAEGGPQAGRRSRTQRPQGASPVPVRHSPGSDLQAPPAAHPELSECTERLARVIATAEHVWDDQDLAHSFLHEPHHMLEDRSPVSVALTELGARRVEDLLWRLFFLDCPPELRSFVAVRRSRFSGGSRKPRLPVRPGAAVAPDRQVACGSESVAPGPS